MNKKQLKVFSVSVSFIIFFLTLIFVLGRMSGIDSLISSGIIKTWGGPLDQIFIFLGYSLKPILIIIGLSVILILYRQKRKNESLLLFTALASGYVLEKIIKILVQRERPEMQLLEKLGYSFPSGHAVFSTILFSLIIYFYKDEIKNNFQKNLFIFLNIFLILLIGFSRIYLNVHWFTDVAGGFFLGLFVINIVLLLAPNMRKNLAKYL